MGWVVTVLYSLGQGSPNDGSRAKCGSLVNFLWLFLTSKYKKTVYIRLFVDTLNNKYELGWNYHQLLISLDGTVMWTKVMSDICKSVSDFLCKSCCVRMPLYMFGYIQFIAKNIVCTRLCQPDVFSTMSLTFNCNNTTWLVADKYE